MMSCLHSLFSLNGRTVFQDVLGCFRMFHGFSGQLDWECVHLEDAMASVPPDYPKICATWSKQVLAVE